MGKYDVMRTDTADMQLHKIILGIAENFGVDVALDKLDDIENKIKLLEDTPYMGVAPKYPVLKRQGYKVIILEKNLVFYKINEDIKRVIIYAIVDQRQDCLNIIIGL
jgi:toxin ParE1/3/4